MNHLRTVRAARQTHGGAYVAQDPAGRRIVVLEVGHASDAGSQTAVLPMLPGLAREIGAAAMMAAEDAERPSQVPALET
ncbi:hypothetical protein [Streptomyces sp. NPDC045470]|uniref:hypothetical protein n=1 Tax=Streptomyces sp. NPDC045470 TaxID=3155469 RepID=UPI0033C4C0BC